MKSAFFWVIRQGHGSQEKVLFIGFLNPEDGTDRLSHYSLCGNPEQRIYQLVTGPSPAQYSSYLHYQTLIPNLTAANKRIARLCVTLLNMHFLTMSSC